MPVDFKKIAVKWQRKWRAAKLFEADADSRPKFFVTFPYPYVNAYAHIGHLYTIMRVEAFARFKRMQGFNVLFPQAFHATGSPIFAAARRVKEGEEKQVNALKLMGFKDDEIPKFSDPLHWVKTFSKAWEADLRGLGVSIDWRRSFITTDLNPRYSKFIKWQFRTLKKKGFISKGEHPVVWSVKLNLPVGDHDRVEGEGETPQEMVLLKFKLGDLVLPCATFRPETVFGVVNIWVNPDIVYVEALVDGEPWIVSEPCVEKLKLQKHSVEVKNKVKGSDFVGKLCVNPVTGDKVPVLPASFVSADTGSGVVMSVPAHAPYDFIALEDIKKAPEKFGVSLELVKDLKPVSLISVPGFGEFPAVEACEKLGIKSQDDKDKLESATNDVYKKEFHTGKLNKRTGKYSGLTIQDAKPKLIKDFVKENKAFILWELVNPVVSRALDKCVVKIVDDQWFIRYDLPEWKDLTMRALEEVKLYPEKVRSQFEYVIDWLKEWACTREFGLGTCLPWDKKWKIESLSDSTIYMAFYTVSHLLKKITLGKINDKLFDFIFFGKGIPDEFDIEPDLLNKLRKEFSYWYPVDFRNSAKDLVQNHLAFFLFNHTAVFPERFWPRGIGVNGYVTVKREKMSKSKGNFLTLRDTVEHFSPDVARITILSSGEELDDVDWDVDNARMFANKLSMFFDFAKKHFASNPEPGENSVDLWFEHKINCAVRDATKAMEATLFRSALMYGFFDLQRYLKWYLRRTNNRPNPVVISRFIKVQILLLAPFVPHFCEELWSKLGFDSFVSVADWPEVDESKINFSLEHSENLIRSVLDDVAHVLNLVKVEHPSLISLFVASDWKFLLFRKVQERVKVSRDLRNVMGAVLPEFKDFKEAPGIVQKLVKDPSRIPSFVSREDAEFQLLNDAVDFFKKTFGCPVRVFRETDSKEPKAKSALPSKPAILVK